MAGLTIGACALLLTGVLAYLALLSHLAAILAWGVGLFRWFLGLSWLAQLGVVVGLGASASALLVGLHLYQVTRD